MSGIWHYGILSPVMGNDGVSGWAVGKLAVEAGDEIGLPWPDGDHWYTVLTVPSGSRGGLALADRRFRLEGWSGWEVRLNTGGDS